MRRKRLTITTRLTITSLLLTGLVVVPAMAFLQVVTRQSIEAHAVALATETARDAVGALLSQWDQEFLIEFGAGSISLRDTGVEWPDWALCRPNGIVEFAAGVFSRGLPPQVAVESRVIARATRKPLRVASVPLITPYAIQFDDLAANMQDAVRRFGRPEQCLKILRESGKDSVVYEVKILSDGTIREVKLRADGSVIDQGLEELPGTLPPDLLGVLSAHGDVAASRIRGWRHHGGHLLAVVTLGPAGTAGEDVGVNRLGEIFRLGPGPNDATPDPGSTLYLTAAVDATAEHRAFRSFAVRMWTGGGMVWMLLVCAAWYVVRRAMRPVQDIVDAVAQIGVERLDARLPVGEARDELARIAATINDMLSRLEDGYRRERVFTMDASHELRTPLAKVIGEIDLALSRARTPDEYRETLERCRRYAAGLERLVSALLLMARLDGSAGRFAPAHVDMGMAAAEIIALLEKEERARVTLSLGESAGPLLARGDKSLLQTLLRNLIDNALRYSQAGMPVRVEVAPDGPLHVRVQVEDRGPGVPADARERVFARFVRLDASRSRESGGFGLGLAIVKAIAHVHNGRVELLARDGGGTIARVLLPMA